MNPKNHFLKYFILLSCILCGFYAKAQYTEVADLKKDSVFTPISFTGSQVIPIKLEIIPRNYYTSKFGFFCQQELKFEKVTALPFKLRLGSVAEVDRMEGKPNTRFIGQ